MTRKMTFVEWATTIWVVAPLSGKILIVLLLLNTTLLIIKEIRG